MLELFSILQNTVCKNNLDEAKNAISKLDTLSDIYSLADKHDLAHLIGFALEKTDLEECEVLEKLRKAKNQAIFRYLKQESDFEKICNVLEVSQISFIPLKGLVLREYYPEPWMRTSSDLDILVHPDKIKMVADILKDELGYISVGKTAHDMSFYSRNGTHLELHYDTIVSDLNMHAKAILNNIWIHASNRNDSQYHMRLSDEMFYFYHMMHMAKHIRNGGCGIRAFLDVWILNHRICFDKEKRNVLLEKGGLLTFATSIERLSEIWFSGENYDALSKILEEYILRGGTYGVDTNRVVIKQGIHRSKTKNIIARIFMPYDSLQLLYPIIQKYRFLTPIFMIVRWLRIIMSGRIQNANRELCYSLKMSKDQCEFAGQLVEHLGLEE